MSTPPNPFHLTLLASHLQPLAHLVRYMRHSHRREWVEGALAQISRIKMWGMPALLDRRFKHVVELKGG